MNERKDFTVLAFYPRTFRVVEHKQTDDSAEAYRIAQSLSQIAEEIAPSEEAHYAVLCNVGSPTISFRFFGGELVQKGGG